MIKDSVGILTNALREMYHAGNITAPPTNCRLTSSNKWQTGQQFYQFLKRQKFNGRSGRITFDDSGDRLFSEYEILNIFNETEITVGRYSFDSGDMKMKLSLMVHSIKWPGNKLQKPLGIYRGKEESIQLSDSLFFTRFLCSETFENQHTSREAICVGAQPWRQSTL